MSVWKDRRLTYPLGTDQVFRCREIPELVIASEVCEDLWTPCPPSGRHCLHGATLDRQSVCQR